VRSARTNPVRWLIRTAAARSWGVRPRQCSPTWRPSARIRVSQTAHPASLHRSVSATIRRIPAPRRGLCVLCACARPGSSFPGRAGSRLRETQQAGSRALARQRQHPVGMAPLDRRAIADGQRARRRIPSSKLRASFCDRPIDHRGGRARCRWRCGAGRQDYVAHNSCGFWRHPR
jgi:hypothetical protein